MSSKQRRKDRHKKEQQAKSRRSQELQQQKSDARRSQRSRYKWLHKHGKSQRNAPSSNPETHSRQLADEGEDQGYITISATVLLLIIGLAFVGGAIIYQAYLKPSPAPETTNSMTTTEAPVLDNAAPDFILAYAGDPSQIFQLSNWRGTPVLIDFFSIRCSACSTYLPILKVIATLYSDRIVMVSISVRWSSGTQPDTREALQQYIIKEDIAWWVVLDTTKAITYNDGKTSSVTEAYGIQATPTTVLVNRGGQVVFNQVGTIPRTTLEAQIQQLLS